MSEELEKLIDKAGRDRVFATARYNGWSFYNLPPEWVWKSICYELLQKDTRP